MAILVSHGAWGSSAHLGRRPPGPRGPEPPAELLEPDVQNAGQRALTRDIPLLVARPAGQVRGGGPAAGLGEACPLTLDIPGARAEGSAPHTRPDGPSLRAFLPHWASAPGTSFSGNTLKMEKPYNELLPDRTDRSDLSGGGYVPL